MNTSKTQKTLISSAIFIVAVASFFLNAIWLSAPILLLILAFCTKREILSKTFSFVLISIFLFAVFYANIKTPQNDGIKAFAPLHNAQIKGRIISLPNKKLNSKTNFKLKVYELKAGKDSVLLKDTKIIVNVYDNQRRFEQLQIGDVVLLKGKLNLPFKAKNPSQFDYSDYLKSKGIFTTFSTKGDNYQIINDSNVFWSFVRQLNITRDDIIKKHASFLESPKPELLGSIVFGDDAVGVPEEVYESFIHAGLLHLLAASGLNVALIFAIWFFIFSKLNINYRVNILSGMGVILLYMLMTGLPPSITRAGIMLELALIGKLIDRKADAMTLLAFVAVLMLLFNPSYIVDISFQLSFLVTFGIIFCSKLINQKFEHIPLWLSSAIILPIVAQIWVLGLQVFYFNNIAPYSIFANILVLPFIGIISFSGFLGSILSLLPHGEKICFVFDKMADPLLSIVLFISDFFNKLNDSLIYVHSLSKIDVFVYYSAVLLLFLLLQYKFKEQTAKILKTAVLSLIVLFFVFYSKIDFNKNLDIIFFSSGNSDAILVGLPNKKHFTIDTGDNGFGGYSDGKTILNEYFKDRGIKKLSSVILTHFDSDHIGGAKDVIEFEEVKSVITPDSECETKTCQSLFEEIKRKKTETFTVKEKEKLVLDKKVKIRVVAPNGEDLSENDSSLITYLKYKDFSALFLGDNSTKCLKYLKKNVNPPITVLKIGHHGGKNSVNDEMLNFLKPRVIIITTGKNNYFHPNKKTVQTIEKHKIPMYRTDFDNAVKISSDGRKTKIYTYDSDKKSWINSYPAK